MEQFFRPRTVFSSTQHTTCDCKTQTTNVYQHISIIIIITAIMQNYSNYTPQVYCTQTQD